MRLKLFDYNKWVKTLKEVSNPKYIENNKFTRNGLFSQQIFGPIKSYHCVCNKLTFRGKRSTMKKCPNCGVEITSSNIRRERYARINLPFKILNPLFYFIICENKYTIRNIIDSILQYKEIYYIENNEIKTVNSEEEKEGKTFLVGIDGILEIVKILYGDKTDPVSKFINENFDQIAIEDIVVIPPAFRPCTKTGGVDSNFIADEINKHYTSLLMSCNSFKKLLIENSPIDDYFIFNFKSIQNKAIELYQFILDKLSKKRGLIRSNILGKRVDFSGRAIITPDPELNLDECGIPYWMILEILKPQLSSYLVDSKIKKRYNSATDLIDLCINNESLKLFKVVKEFCKDKVCILNRQPTLHRLSILGFKVIPHEGKTIKIHPLVCSAYNADFDGDAMALYFPVTEKSEEDVKNKISIWNNLLSPTDGNIVAVPNQDIVLGIYALTKESKTDNMVIYKGKEITEGRKKFNDCLPIDYPLVNRVIGKNELYVILNRIALIYKNEPKKVINTLDAIKKLGFQHSTKLGFTLNILNMYSDKLEEYSKELTGEIKKDLVLMKAEKVIKELKSLPFSIFVDSGARGSWDQVKQLVYCRGYVADSNNQIRKNIIRTNLISGLTPDDFFNSSYGARKGLLDTAMSTGSSGYITRQLIYSTNFIEIVDEPYIEKELLKFEKSNKDPELNLSEEKVKIAQKLNDCGSTEYLEFTISTKPSEARKQIKSIVGRYYLNNEGNLSKIPEWLSIKDEKVYEELYGKTLKLRTPIYCNNKKICHVCYGDNYKTLHSSQIGIIATQAIGERLTQLVLRTFHTSGVVGDIDEKKNKNNVKEKESNKDIISGMSYVNGLLHRPTTMFEEKTKKEITEKDVVLRLYELFSTYGDIYLVHFETIVSAMLWTDGGNYWRTTPNRETITKNIESILKVPSLSSWLIGLAFSNVKSKLIEGIIHNRQDVETSISSLFRF